MEQITRTEDGIYYGKVQCLNINDAYSRFRNDYNHSVSRAAYLRLNRLGQRTDRIKGRGFVFDDRTVSELKKRFWYYDRVPCWLLGIMHISYCWIVGTDDMPRMDEETHEKFVEWIFMNGSKGLKFMDRRNNMGRTGKFYNRKRR